jgi:hypothetical protein
MDPALLGRRRFDHLFTEASVAAGRRLPRFALWMACHEAGVDPEALSRDAALRFCRAQLPAFLAGRGLALAPRDARRLLREVGRFDPARPTPYERFAALGAP